MISILDEPYLFEFSTEADGLAGDDLGGLGWAGSGLAGDSYTGDGCAGGRFGAQGFAGGPDDRDS